VFGDFSLAAIGFAVAAFMGLTAVRDLKRGELTVSQFATPVTRADSPVAFWFATTLALAMAALALATSISAVGKLAGWWEFGS
jgi:hypothetical protein